MIDLGKAKLMLLSDMVSFTVPLFEDWSTHESVQLQLKELYKSSLRLGTVKVEGINIEIGEHKPPAKDVCSYDHIDIKTPLETLRIEWKDWKDTPCYSCMGVDSGFDYATYLANSLPEAIALAVAAYADRLKACFVEEEKAA